MRGGNHNVELKGAADMGGLLRFGMAGERSEGDHKLIAQSVVAMSAKSDPTVEDNAAHGAGTGGAPGEGGMPGGCGG